MTKLQDAVTRLDRFISNERVLRHLWVDFRGGYQYACLLSAFSESVFAAARARDIDGIASGAGSDPVLACPADLLPPWFAELTPYLNDTGEATDWLNVVRRWRDLVAVEHSPEWWASAKTQIQIAWATIWLDHGKPDVDVRGFLHRAIYAWTRGKDVEPLLVRVRERPSMYGLTCLLRGELFAAGLSQRLESLADRLVPATLDVLEAHSAVEV